MKVHTSSALRSTAPHSSSSSTRRRHASSDRLLRLIAGALVVLVSVSLLLSSVRLRCQSSTTSSSSTRQTSTNPTNPTNPTSSSSISHCSATTIDPRGLLYNPPHKFIDLLQTHHPLFPPPSLVRKHRHLCDPEPGDREWTYCLPITARHDLPYCAAADRMDLLSPQSPRTLCYASVLHLLLVDVYDELERHGARPALLFGSLLGAVRNASLISYTEDVDLGFVNSPTLRMRKVQLALRRKGYHLFRQGILRVCVAPTHPLAHNLYDPRRDSLHRARHVPYVDLYRMQLAPNRKEWEIEEIRNDRRVPMAQFEPYTNAEVNGMKLNTLADPLDFLQQEYGVTWRTPLKRGAYRVVNGNITSDLPGALRPPRAFPRHGMDMVDGEYDSAVDYDDAMPEIEDVDAGENDWHDARPEEESDDSQPVDFE